MAQQATDRIAWAVATLDVKPDDRILEIGCGHGVAVALVCAHLTHGTITAIDRSPKMIEMATRRNQAHVDAGKARFVCTTLEEAELGETRFDKIFAIRVNFFIQQPAVQLAKIKSLLAPEGTIYLFNDPPNATKAAPFVELATQSLPQHGFVVTGVIEKSLGALQGVGIVARTRV